MHEFIIHTAREVKLTEEIEGRQRGFLVELIGPFGLKCHNPWTNWYFVDNIYWGRKNVPLRLLKLYGDHHSYDQTLDINLQKKNSNANNPK